MSELQTPTQWQLDTDFDYCEIAKVEPMDGGRYAITSEQGWAFGPDCEWPFEPKVGMKYRTYPKGLGHTIRGLVVDGVCIFYRTVEEEKERHRQWCADRDAATKAGFEKNKADLDARYDALPDHFKRRLDKFRTNNPDFRWRYEPYELMCCEDAVKIASAMEREDVLPGADDKIKAFYDLPWDEQKNIVPGLHDGHSGNSFGMAVHLARLYLNDPEDVVRLHGALAPLVGSEEYGCVPRSQE